MTEPNQPPRLILSQNCRGLKSANRLDHCIAALSRTKADVLLLQELGLHVEDSSRFKRICRRYGYLGFAAYLPSTRTHGGTAVLIKWASFGLGPKQALPHKTFLNAGAVTVQLPPEGNEPPLSFASVYVPVKARARKLFIHNLKLARLITQHTIVGADRNSVADLSLDVKYRQGATTEYSNGHAAMWDRLMAGAGLRDVYRELEGPKARQYTRLGSSVHTRIDCLFGPCKSQVNQWYSIKCARLNNASWNTDHLALIAQMRQAPANPDIGKGPKRINADILLDNDFTCPAIRTLYREIDERYPKGEYGSKPTWNKKLASVAHLMQGQSADYAKSAHIDKYLEHSLNQKIAIAQMNDPSPKFEAILRRIDKEKKRARAKKPRDPHSCMRRTHFEEMSTKEFYSKFKARHVKRYINELYQVDNKGKLRTKGGTVSTPGDMLLTLTNYYETLMSDKGSDRNASDKLFAKLRKKKPVQKRQRLYRRSYNRGRGTSRHSSPSPTQKPRPRRCPPRVLSQVCNSLGARPRGHVQRVRCRWAADPFHEAGRDHPAL